MSSASSSSGQLAAEYKDRVFADLPARVLGRPHAQTPTCCATPKSSSRRSSTTRCGLGAEKIATGHYARVSQRNENYALLKRQGHGEGQSYFSTG